MNEKPINLVKLVAWHLLMAAALVACWQVPSLWILPLVLTNIAGINLNPRSNWRIPSVLSASVIIVTLAIIGAFFVALDNGWLGKSPADAPVDVKWLRLAVLPVVALASWRLIARWRHRREPRATPPSPPEKPGRTIPYHCPCCCQPDSVAAGFLIREPRFNEWGCPRCGSLIGVKMKHPIINGILQIVFLALFLAVTQMKLAPLWITASGFLISHLIIQYLTRGITIVAITRHRDFIEEELDTLR